MQQNTTLHHSSRTAFTFIIFQEQLNRKRNRQDKNSVKMHAHLQTIFKIRAYLRCSSS